MAEIIPFPTRHDPLLSKRQLAQLRGVSTKTIDRRVKDGLPSRMIQGQRKFRLSETMHWFEREALRDVL